MVLFARQMSKRSRANGATTSTQGTGNTYTEQIVSRAFSFINNSYEDHLDFNWDTCACLVAKHCFENDLSADGRVQGEHPMPSQLTAAFLPYGITCEARGCLYAMSQTVYGDTWDGHITLTDLTTNALIAYSWYFKKNKGLIQLHYNGCSSPTATTPVRRKRKINDHNIDATK
jgi:hypothetical protein